MFLITSLISILLQELISKYLVGFGWFIKISMHSGANIKISLLTIFLQEPSILNGQIQDVLIILREILSISQVSAIFQDIN